MSPGRIFTVVGPSGAGKDTLMAGLKAHLPKLHIVRRVITRPETPGDEPYEAVSREEFAHRRAIGAFALWWDAHGLSYGIPVSVRGVLAEGRDVLFNGSRAALPSALLAFPDLRVLLVTAPPEVLAERLAKRGRESAADILARLGRAEFDLPPGLKVTKVVNDQSTEAGVAALVRALQPESVLR